MNGQEKLKRCILACEAEAVSADYPPSLGREIIEGCIRVNLEGWTDEQLLDWVDLIQNRYIPKISGEHPVTHRAKVQRLWDLYKAASKIVEFYGSIKQ
ncbi:hypothetical protein NIES2098_41970 [Calothrix sp. NIES-2098]|nr:hypothetical protein NIES2098_41970 [Calothrix sp. NIES-2098]